MSCGTYKSIKIEFTEPDIKPKNGYRVQYRIIGASDYTTLSPNPKGSPIIIPSVASCLNVEGTIETDNDSGYGSPISFVAASGTEGNGCSYYVCTEPVIGGTSIYRYVPCGADSPVTKTVTSGKTITTGICAEDQMGVAKIFGEGVVTKEGHCTTDNPVTTSF